MTHLWVISCFYGLFTCLWVGASLRSSQLRRRVFSVEAFTAGTLAGAGSFRCETCGFAIALHELDEVPACPQCGGRKFKRASMFMAQNGPAGPDTAEHDQLLPPTGTPEWLADAREALVTDGDYVA